MPKKDILQKVEDDISSGDLGKARDRLTTLLRNEPSDLEVRFKLGEIYHELQYPERAGQLWYLFPSNSPEVKDVKQVFSARHKDDPRAILGHIEYKGGLDALQGSPAYDILTELATSANMPHDELVTLTAPQKKAARREREDSGRANKLIGVAIVVALIVFLVGFINGIVTLIRFLFNLTV